jgi:hypothetical protein
MKADGESLWPVVERATSSIASLIRSREELRAQMHARLRAEADCASRSSSEGAALRNNEQALRNKEQALLNNEQALRNKEQ